MKRNEVIREFNSMLEEIGGRDPAALFKRLRRYDLTKVELMIVDSAIKGMRLETLDRTLLLTEDNYLDSLQKLTATFIDMYHTETKKGTNSSGPR